jgi:hypothetical protein
LRDKAKIPRQRLGFLWPGDLVISGQAYEFSSLMFAIESLNVRAHKELLKAKSYTFVIVQHRWF